MQKYLLLHNLKIIYINFALNVTLEDSEIHAEFIDLNLRNMEMIKKYLVISTLTALLAVLLTVSTSTKILAQSIDYKVVAVGFYNLENLFDTENDTTINDEEFLPDGGRGWTEERYAEKQANMAYVISEIGKDKAPQGLSVLGVAEIENRKVLEDLVSQASLKDRNYKIVHFDSKDARGIDVALLYNPSHFIPTHSQIIDLPIFNDDSIPRYTRDILYVKGDLDGDEVHFLVNHWPSRRGGADRTDPHRIRGAKICKEVIDSLTVIDPNVKVIVMGDVNDDPTSESVKSGLMAVADKDDAKIGRMYNPMEDFYRRGQGSNAYRDNWSLFDQMIFTPGWLDTEDDGYFFYRANIFNKQFLVQRKGQYKGYPFRTFSGSNYQSGYSDHYP